jgi:hypothetical protein
MVCTHYLVDFFPHRPPLECRLNCPSCAEIAAVAAQVTSVTPRVCHFQTQNTLVLSLNVTGVRLTRRHKCRFLRGAARFQQILDLA